MRRYCETCKDIVQDGPEPHVCICKHSHLASQCPFCKVEKERDALRASVSALSRLLTRCRSELQSVLADINAEQVPYDGDDFHELLRDLNKALEPTK